MKKNEYAHALLGLNNNACTLKVARLVKPILES